MDSRSGYPNRKFSIAYTCFTISHFWCVARFTFTRGGPNKVRWARHSSESCPLSRGGGDREREGREMAHVTSSVKTYSCTTLPRHFQIGQETEEGKTLRLLSLSFLFVCLLFVKEFPLCPYTEKLVWKYNEASLYIGSN